MLKNLKIGAKIIAGFSVALALMIIISVYSIMQVKSLDSEIKNINEDKFPKAQMAYDAVYQIADQARAFRNAILTSDDKDKANQLARVQETRDTLKAIVERIEPMITSEEGKALFAKVKEARVVFISDGNKLLDYIKSNNDSAAIRHLFSDMRISQTSYIASWNTLVDFQSKLMKDAGDAASSTANQSLIIISILSIVAIVLALIIAIVIKNGITKPISEVLEAASNIANGNTNVKLDKTSNDETGDLIDAMGIMVNTIKALVTDANMLAKAAIDGKLSTRADASKHKGDFRTIVEGVNNTLDSVIGPLNVAAEYVDRISKGDIPAKISDNYNGDFNEIKNNLNGCIDAVNALVSDANMLANAAIQGKLSTRADSHRHYGDFRAIVEGVNNTLDNVIGPLNVAAEYVDRISKGDIPAKITDNYNGDFNEIKNNLNGCIDAVNALVSDANMLANAAVEGKLSTRADANRHYGDFRAIVVGVNNTLDSVIGPLNVAAEYVDRISKGDIPAKISDNYNGDFNEIKNNLNGCIDAINALVNDAKMLANAAVEGRLSTRAEANRHYGDFRAIVEGVNNTLDNVIGPLNVAAEYVDRISKGDIPAKISDNYNGDFNSIKNNLNTCIDAVNALVCDTKMLANAAVEGQLSTRADASKHQGDFRAVVIGVNNTLDSVIGPLNVAAQYVDKISKGEIPAKITDNYNGDFNTIKINLNTCIDAVNALVSDAKMLALAATEGRLTVRADAAKHHGDFKVIVEGVNTTLDKVIDPITEASSVLAEISNGDLTSMMTGNYQGDLDQLKSSINHLAMSLDSVISKFSESVQSTSSTAVEMSSTAETMAAAAQEQSSQADEVASAVEEMSHTVSANAMSAGRTAEVAEKNGEVAREGGKVVEQTIKKMRDISVVVSNSASNIEKLGESSKEIGEIISVIDDIADQTNLLALNAAIEAARAGEQGRGFAVVADEVRKLAERTTEATKQIADMIKGIQSETQEAVIAMKKGTDEVTSGIELADKAGDSLRQVVSSSQEVLDMINQIAAASEEQSSTAEQISKNVVSISKVTAESAHSIEDIAHSSDNLSRLTEQLSDLVAQFNTSTSQRSGSKMSLSNQRHGKGLPGF